MTADPRVTIVHALFDRLFQALDEADQALTDPTREETDHA